MRWDLVDVFGRRTQLETVEADLERVAERLEELGEYGLSDQTADLRQFVSGRVEACRSILQEDQ